MSPQNPEGPASPQGRNLRRFIVAHVVAIGAIFGLSIMAGGGFAGPPMPPDEAVRLAASRRVDDPSESPARSLPPSREPERFEPPSHDVAAPWALTLREVR